MLPGGRFEARVRELVPGQATLEGLAEPMLRARAALRAEFAALHREVLRIVRVDADCRRMMTVPGASAPAAQRRARQERRRSGPAGMVRAATPPPAHRFPRD
jgi:transposase